MVDKYCEHNFSNSTKNEKAYKIQHSIEVDYEKGCSGECDDSKPCGEGFSCVDNQCCSCRREEFTLVLRNLTFLATNRNGWNSKVELKGGFHQNISYDHSECCQQKGISPLCRGMCKASEMDQYHFDPTRSLPFLTGGDSDVEAIQEDNYHQDGEETGKEVMSSSEVRMFRVIGHGVQHQKANKMQHWLEVYLGNVCSREYRQPMLFMSPRGNVLQNSTANLANRKILEVQVDVGSEMWNPSIIFV